jgi:acyl-CoA synthetase (AMP-forming)/AMP-acid ligase II
MNLALYPHLLARYEPERPAVVEANGAVVNYGQFEIMARGVAHRLREAGLARGDLCALAIREDARHLAAIFAIWRLGAILLPLDWRSPPAEVETVAARFKPRLILAAAGPIRPPSGVAPIALEGPEPRPDEALPVEPLDDDPALYALSSGSTGEPKAAIITHRQHAARVMSYAVSYPLLRSDRYLSTLPIAYNWGRNIAISHLCLGATLIFHPMLFAPADLVEAVERLQATTIAVVPSVSHGLLRLPQTGRRLMERLRQYVSSGAPLYPEERRAIRERVCANLVEAYGSTETGGICVLAPEDQERAPASAGRPAIGVELEVIGDDDRALPPGEIGRIRCRGPGVIAGYLNGGASDNERTRGGWFYPGDYGRLDAEGFLFLEGRSNDIIKRGGYTIYASEIERALAAHPAVAEATVVGVAAPELGEDIVAFVVLRAATDPRELVNHCRLRLAGFKQPQRIKVVATLPRNAAGKVVKSALIGTKN